MKRQGSVRGRADAGTGSGPGVERVITVLTGVEHEQGGLSRSVDMVVIGKLGN